MEPLLIVIVIVLVLAITFILSRPFWKAAPAQGAIYGSAENPVDVNEDFEQEDQQLMQEIRSLETHQDENLSLQDSSISDQIETKKDQTANLLPLTHPAIKEQAGTYEAQHNAPAQDDTLDAAQICTQCGSQTLTNDKFCSKCGHRLLP